MGLCEYCQNKPATYEVLDDQTDSGVVMICEDCYKQLNLDGEVNEMNKTNPRGLKRPQNGTGGGVGRAGGQRQGKNTGGCKNGGPGQGKGGGQGRGTKRKG